MYFYLKREKKDDTSAGLDRILKLGIARHASEVENTKGRAGDTDLRHQQ